MGARVGTSTPVQARAAAPAPSAKKAAKASKAAAAKAAAAAAATAQSQVSPQHTAPSATPADMTSALVQRYLDENHCLIAAIVEHHSKGNAAAADMYQNRLQHNLIYLAALSELYPNPVSSTPTTAAAAAATTTASSSSAHSSSSSSSGPNSAPGVAASARHP